MEIDRRCSARQVQEVSHRNPASNDAGFVPLRFRPVTIAMSQSRVPFIPGQLSMRHGKKVNGIRSSLVRRSRRNASSIGSRPSRWTARPPCRGSQMKRQKIRRQRLVTVSSRRYCVDRGRSGDPADSQLLSTSRQPRRRAFLFLIHRCRFAVAPRVASPVFIATRGSTSRIFARVSSPDETV